MAISVSIFYSWESDLPADTNRTLIENALKMAVHEIEKSSSPAFEIKIEQDARGKSGSPDLAAEIFNKIEKASVFISDVSIIGEISGKFVPNPNVMIEHGYALKSLGADLVLAICNKATGKPEQLPFDIRHRRVITYEAKKGAKNIAEITGELANELERDLRTILSQIVVQKQNQEETTNTALTLVAAISNGSSALQKPVDSFWKNYLERIVSIDPAKKSRPMSDDQFISALDESVAIQASLYEVLDAIASNDSKNAALALVDHFGQLIDLYNFKGGGSFFNNDFDFYKFLGHELGAALVAFLYKYKRWQTLEEVLRTKFLVSNTRRQGQQMMGIEDLSEWLEILDQRKSRLKENRISIHADILNARHSQGPLSDHLTAAEFREGDLLLFLVSFSRSAGKETWHPWSSLYINHGIPKLIVESTVKQKAQPVMLLMNKVAESDFKATVKDANLALSKFWGFYWRNPLDNFDFETLASL